MTRTPSPETPVSGDEQQPWRFEARAGSDGLSWGVWDVTDLDHVLIAVFDSRGAADDFHEENAQICAAALNARRFGAAPTPSADVSSLTAIERAQKVIAEQPADLTLEQVTAQRNLWIISASDFEQMFTEAAMRLERYREALEAQGIALAAWVNLLQPTCVTGEDGDPILTGESVWQRDPTRAEVQAALEAQNNAAAALKAGA